MCKPKIQRYGLDEDYYVGFEPIVKADDGEFVLATEVADAICHIIEEYRDSPIAVEKIKELAMSLKVFS